MQAHWAKTNFSPQIFRFWRDGSESLQQEQQMDVSFANNILKYSHFIAGKYFFEK